MRIAAAARKLDPARRTPVASFLRSLIPPRAFRYGLAAVLVLSAVFGGALGYFIRIDSAGLTDLEGHAAAQMSRVLDREGQETKAFATEKRILLGEGEVPLSFRQALIASEDSRFEEHAGIDLVGGARAFWSDVRERRMSQGASTLTMQLAGMVFLDRSQRTVQRKLQEIVLAFEIERGYSKDEILRFYTNQVHFGHGLYGLEAAARYYFGKPARALDVGESATLVGVLPRPASYSPFHNPERATERRNLVLRRMVAEGYLTAAAARAVADEPIVLADRTATGDVAPYFNEQVRRWLDGKYGSEAVYRGGLVVKTTLDRRLQQAANRAVEVGLGQLQQRMGADATEAQAALVAIDPRNGEILALVGGTDFSRSEYDRAIQAKRQTGSLFKSFVYAAALEQGWTLADTLLDEPTVFLDRRNPIPYQPENFSRKYYETITLRTAMEKSANIATVKLLERVGYDAAIDVSRRLGVDSRLRPFPSLALGAFELSLLEVTSAYGAFANEGLHFEPHWISEVTDGGGSTLHRSEHEVTAALSPQVAYLMTRALSGVMERGTGKSAGAVLDHTLAGKTGTTDDNTDAWFVGYSSELVVGVWVGYDEPRTLGAAETGGRAALPIWIEFMREALAGREDVPFTVPDGITTVRVDRRTGRRPGFGTDCTDQISEVFIEGTEPTAACARARHDQLLLPYPLQRYELDADGALMIPGDELSELLQREVQLYLNHHGVLEAYTPSGTVTLPVVVLPDSARTLAWTGVEEPDGRLRVGTDGRPAVQVWFGGPPPLRERSGKASDQATNR